MVTIVSPNDTMHPQCSSLKKTSCSAWYTGFRSSLSCWLCDSSQFSYLVCLECKDCWRFHNISPCNFCSSPNFHILKDLSFCSCLSKFFQHPQGLCFIFYLLALFQKGFMYKQFCKFYFSFYLSWCRAMEWFFVFDEVFEHLSSSFVPINPECTFLFNLRIISSTSWSHSSLLLICSSSKHWLYSLCAATTNLQDVIELCQLFFNSNFVIAGIN